VNLLDVAHRFVTEHAEVIGASALHVYDSALQFTPKDTILFKTFQHEFETPVRMLTSSKISWNLPSNAVKDHPPKGVSATIGAKLFSFRKSRQGTTVRTHDVVDKRLAHPISRIAVCPDGTRLVTETLHSKEMRILDTSTGKEVVKFDFLSPVKFSPDSQHIALGTKTGVQIWDLITGKFISKFACPELSLAEFSSDGTRIVSEFLGGNWCNEVHLRDSKTGRLMASLGYGSLRDVIFSPDGTRLVFLSAHGMELWDVTTGRRLVVLECRPPSNFSPDASGSFAVFGCWPPINFSPDSSHIMYHHPDGLRLWDSVNGALAENLELPSSGSSFVTLESQPTYVLRDKWVIGSLEGRQKWICWLPLVVRGRSPVFSSDGKYFVLGNEQGEWTVFDLSHLQWTHL
jgi:WD40 repeat protein